jgi:hypothetical protein
MIIEPKTETENTFYSAIVMLLSSTGPPSFSQEQFVALAKAVPDYALRLIEANRSDLTPLNLRHHDHQPTSARVRTSEFVMTAEWELKGSSKFIADNGLPSETDFTRFMDDRLERNPNHFSLSDLHSLVKIYRKDVPIRRRALQAIDKRVTSMAGGDSAEKKPPND